MFDVDDRTLDDTVDAILVPIVPSRLRAYSEAELYSGVFGYGKLKARYRVDCEDNFFGSGEHNGYLDSCIHINIEIYLLL